MTSRKDELTTLLAGMTDGDKRFLFGEIAKGLIEKHGLIQHHSINDGSGKRVGYFVPPAAWVEFPLKQDKDTFLEQMRGEGESMPMGQFLTELRKEFPDLCKEWDSLLMPEGPPPRAQAG